jgi:hypothetical protein
MIVSQPAKAVAHSLIKDSLAVWRWVSERIPTVIIVLSPYAVSSLPLAISFFDNSLRFIGYYNRSFAVRIEKKSISFVAPEQTRK